MTGKKAPELCKRVCTPLGIVKRLPSLSTPQSRALYPLLDRSLDAAVWSNFWIYQPL